MSRGRCERFRIRCALQAHYLADNRLLIDFINDQIERREFLKQLLRPEEDLHCCTINMIEVFAGMRKGEEELTVHWFDQFSFYDVTREIAQEAGVFALSMANLRAIYYLGCRKAEPAQVGS